MCEDKVLDAMIDAYLILEDKINEQIDDLNQNIKDLRKYGIKIPLIEN